ncbi:MAG TPA: metallophosphoesterase [Chryseolinea sp.]|nr:metallophosphoesterase [Chryseolinea sp.]HPM31209.1 metallophosphoesterase [Chryseolinea sp.]
MPHISSTSIDFIGDIHGHAEELEMLLEHKLGYTKTNGFYEHETRKAFFVGDFIDRGPDIKKVLEVIRPMIDHGAAYTVIGNHEYNAICYWSNDEDGKPLREHTDKNNGQHKKTIDSFSNIDHLKDYVDWFKTLPIYFESDQFRVIHAQWKQEYVDHLKNNRIDNFTSLEFLIQSANKHTHEHKIIECLLKGEEVEVPDVAFKDKDGNERFAYRVKWWMKGNNLLCNDSLFEFPEESKSHVMPISSAGYGEHEVPVLFGHYWLKNSQPKLQKPNVCCLDFSVAKKGILVAYRWNGERELTAENFRYVKNEIQ